MNVATLLSAPRTVFVSFVFAAFLLVATSGCGRRSGPVLGRVIGTVTVDGQPASGVGVIFSQEGFRSSSAITDNEGKYKLRYVKQTMGAVVGEHRVRIDFVSKEGGTRRRLPEQYNRETTLIASVKRGSNTIDFAVDSK